jgi:hypothetical protein
MVKFAAQNPERYDIAFTKALQCEPKVCIAMEKEYKFAPNAPFEDNFKHKYLLDMVFTHF